MTEETQEVQTEETTPVLDAEQFVAMQEEVTRLREHQQKLLDEAKEAKRKAKDAEDLRKQEAAEMAKKNGDVEAVEKSLREHYAGELETRDNAIKSRDSLLEKLLVNDQSTKLATDLAVDTDSIPVLSEFIRNRLAVQEVDGEFKTVVKGEDGKPTGLSLDEFSQHIQTNKSLSRLLKGSQAAGGGASGSKGGGAANKTVTRQQWDAMSHIERSKHSSSGGTVIDN